ncbi:MAG: hypothetical protein NVSMB55_25740 [Mycobacteriales bacterium]
MFAPTRLRVRCSRDGSRLTVSGPLTARTRGRLLDKVHRSARPDLDCLIIDVDALTFFDAESLLVLLGTERVIERQRGCAIDIRGLDTATERITGLR